MRSGAVAIAVLLVALAAASPAAGRARSAAKIRSAAVSWAVRQAGIHEIGTTNCSPAIDRWTRHMGLRGCRPWCGSYVHEAFLHAGLRLSPRLIDPDRSFADALAGRRHMHAIPKGQVAPGDILFFKFREGVRASHFAIVRTRPRNGAVLTAEGNVSHAVRLGRRALVYAVLAARVTP